MTRNRSSLPAGHGAPTSAEATTHRPAPLRAAPDGESRADRVYRQLREDIFELRLPPGERLTEGGVAARFDVSRTPAREALQRLQGEGLMRGYVRGGWEVAPVDFQRFGDLYEMCELVETFAVRRVCECHARQAPDVAQTLDALDAVWTVPPSQRLDDGGRVAELDEAFRLALAGVAGNLELPAMLRQLIDRLHVVHRLGFVHGDRVGDTYDEHQALLSAIRAGRVEEAVTHVARHICCCRKQIRLLDAQRIVQGASPQANRAGDASCPAAAG